MNDSSLTFSTIDAAFILSVLLNKLQILTFHSSVTASVKDFNAAIVSRTDLVASIDVLLVPTSEITSSDLFFKTGFI